VSGPVYLSKWVTVRKALTRMQQRECCVDPIQSHRMGNEVVELELALDLIVQVKRCKHQSVSLDRCPHSIHDEHIDNPISGKTLFFSRATVDMSQVGTGRLSRRN